MIFQVEFAVFLCHGGANGLLIDICIGKVCLGAKFRRVLLGPGLLSWEFRK